MQTSSRASELKCQYLGKEEKSQLERVWWEGLNIFWRSKKAKGVKVGEKVETTHAGYPADCLSWTISVHPET